MLKYNFLFLFSLLFSCQSVSQNRGITFQNAVKQGISFEHLDSIYTSAIHADSSLAVFKTEIEEEELLQAYTKLLQDFGKFLSANNFKWEKPTKCFNRIYFSADGTIDYFLYNFLGSSENKPNEENQKEFDRLLNVFISDYKISITADKKFAQCSPTTYKP